METGYVEHSVVCWQWQWLVRKHSDITTDLKHFSIEINLFALCQQWDLYKSILWFTPLFLFFSRRKPLETFEVCIGLILLDFILVIVEVVCWLNLMIHLSPNVYVEDYECFSCYDQKLSILNWRNIFMLDQNQFIVYKWLECY